MQALLWIVIVLLTSLYALGKYLVGVSHTPPGSVFLGTVHYPTDYFIYLSEYAWGRHSWFFNRVLQSTEAPGDNLIRWVNVFCGHIFSLFGLNQITAYQISVVLFTVSIIYLSYTLLVKILKSRHEALYGLFVYLTANAFPGWDGSNLSTFDFWYNQGNPLNRLINVPHHLLGQIALLALVYIWISKKKNLLSFVVAIICGMILAGVNGVHLLFAAGIMSVSRLSLPVLFSLIGAAPILLSVRHTLSIPPLSNMIIWETNNQMILTPWRLFLGYGPILLSLLPATIMYLKKPDRFRIFSLLFTWISLLLFLSPIPKLLHLGNVRFLIPFTHILLSIMVIDILRRIKIQTIKTIIVSVYIGVSALSLYATGTKIYALYQNPANPFYYLPKPVYSLFAYSGNISKPDDVFLLGWPYNAIFPGISGSQSYFSEVLLVKDPVETGKLAEIFFSDESPIPERIQFLNQFGITYIIHREETLSPSSGLPIQQIRSEGGFTLWKVVK